MHILLNIFSVIFLLIISNSVYSKTIQIDFTPYETYSIEVAHIDVGDTIEWLPNADHNVEFLVGPNMNSLPEKSKFNVFYSVNFNTPGVYLYHCTPHGNMGMLGLIIVGNNFNNLKDIEEIQLSPVAKSVLQKLVKISKSNL
ncbi:MAG: pseudoazurin [Gammaproteobacteria bacterium]|nr:pseudoazurin [Gammaproteobacteria bacterium]